MVVPPQIPVSLNAVLPILRNQESPHTIPAKAGIHISSIVETKKLASKLFYNSKNILIQIPPFRVFFLDKLYLPLSFPFLNLLLSLKRCSHITMYFEIN